MGVRLKQRGGSRPGAGRPKGPAETVRHNRVTFALTDAELMKLKALAEECALPIGKTAYEIVARVLRHRP